MQCSDVHITVAQIAVRKQPRDKPPKKKQCYVCPPKSYSKIKKDEIISGLIWNFKFVT